MACAAIARQDQTWTRKAQFCNLGVGIAKVCHAFQNKGKDATQTHSYIQGK
jgi:hypothetical protein